MASVKEKLAGMKETIVNNPSFTLKEQLGYAGGIFGNAMGQDSVQTFAEKFFRNFMGINNDRMILMSNILLGLGFAVPPIAGNILDTPVQENKQTPSKRILRLMPLPIAVSSLMLFIVPSTDRSVNFFWALLFNLIFNTTDGFYDISLNTLSLRMTTNAKDRKNFYTLGTFAAALGSMLPGWLIPIVVGKMADVTQQKWAYFFLSLVFSVLGVVSMFLPCFTLNEKLRVTKRPEKTRINWNRQTVSTVLHCRSFIVMEIATFFEQIRSISYTMLNYIYDDTFNDYGMKAIIDIISGTLNYAGLAAVPFVSNRLSARTVLSGSFAYTGVFYALMSLFGLRFDKDNVRKKRYLIGMLIGLAGMPNNAISASKKVVVGDATDYMEWYSDRKFGTPIRSEGLVSATQSILGNVFNIIKTNLYNILYKKIGYQESTIGADGKTIKPVQTDDTLRGLYLMFTLCGLCGNMLAAVSYLFDNYTGKKREAILAELNEMRAARSGVRPEAVDSEILPL